MRLIDADEIRIKPEYMHDICGSVMIRVEDVVRIISEMPTIDPQPQWIPVSERLPEGGNDVLVTDGYVIWTSKLLESMDGIYHWEDNCVWDAWMPLLERYKKKE